MALPAVGAVLAKITPYIVAIVSWLATAKGLKWLASVAISIVVYIGFYNLCSSIFNRFSTSLESATATISGVTLASADGGILAQVNYFFPLDLFATLVIAYASIWSGVFVFRCVTRAFNMLSNVAEKRPGQ